MRFYLLRLVLTYGASVYAANKRGAAERAIIIMLMPRRYARLHGLLHIYHYHCRHPFRRSLRLAYTHCRAITTIGAAVGVAGSAARCGHVAGLIFGHTIYTCEILVQGSQTRHCNARGGVKGSCLCNVPAWESEEFYRLTNV